MIYRTNVKNNDSLSVLGFGCMRFPKSEAETEAMLDYAIQNGVNFFDTAYIYPNSEATLGRILQKLNRREQIKIATKLPPYFVKKHSDLDKIFEQQLKRLQTDYIDYYFMHMLTDVSVWTRLVGLGILPWLDEKRAQGKIKNIGFSYHGGREEFIRLCDVYPWGFCMIQYNYLDEHNLAGVSGLRYAAGKGIPVFVMEPLRGGVLATQLPKGAAMAFEQADTRRTPAEWALRWLFNQPEVTCVLSGMSDMSVLTENIQVAQTAQVNAFSQQDFEAIAQAKTAFAQTIKVNCTACGYCMPCPQGVDIPTCLFCYNDIAISGKMRAFSNYLSQTMFKAHPQNASRCNQCKLCEKKCPQLIPIADELANTVRAFEKRGFKPLVKIVKWFMKL
jgi:hypothetical protein